MPSLKHLFWLLKSRVDASGKAPLSLRIYVDSARTEVSLGFSVPVRLWVAEAQSCKGQSTDAQLCNKAINDLRLKVNELFAAIRKGSNYSSADIRNFLKGKDASEPITLLTCIDRIIEQMKGQGRKDRSIKQVEAKKRTIEEFLLSRSQPDLPIAQVNLRLMADLEAYLRITKKLSHNYIERQVKTLKRAVTYAYLHEYIPSDSLLKYKYTKIKGKKIIYLTVEEIRLISTYRFTSARLQRVADVFVFQCYTGLAFAEYSRLSSEHIIRSMDGSEHIEINRQKTDAHGSVCRVPLLEEAKVILQKYASDPSCLFSGRLLPVISVNKANKYLKEIAALTGITKPISTHIGRKTALTLFLNMGMPIEIVSSIAGHRDIKTTRDSYAHLLEKTVSTEMQKVQERLRKQG